MATQVAEPRASVEALFQFRRIVGHRRDVLVIEVARSIHGREEVRLVTLPISHLRGMLSVIDDEDSE